MGTASFFRTNMKLWMFEPSDYDYPLVIYYSKEENKYKDLRFSE